jgi:hypothetical protein
MLRFKLLIILLSLKTSFENYCPSPDGRENPLGPGFGPKDWKEQQVSAPYHSTPKTS